MNSKRFLCFLLSLSVLPLPTYGGWDDIFNPDDQGSQALGAVGSNIFSFLDDHALGRAAQVSQKWRRLVDKRRTEHPDLYRLPAPLIRPQRDLIRDLLESLKARPDVFSALIQDIRSAVLAGLPFEQQSTLKSKFPNLVDPNLSLYPWHLLRDLDDLREERSLSTTHKGFQRLKEVTETLKTLAEAFPTLRSRLQRLRAVYEQYMEDLCALQAGERGPLLFPVFLQGDFLKRSYLVSESTAYQLLSMGKLGIPEKKNETGSSIVTPKPVGKIYAKQNLIKPKQTEALPTGTLDPGMEWAMSSFHRLLFGEGLVSSSLVTLSSVPIKQPLSREKQEEERNLIERAKSLGENGRRDQAAILNRLDEDVSFKNTKAYALQLTPEVQGEFLKVFLEKALKNPALFDELETPQVQALILSALLTHSADAKDDNFMVTPLDARGKRQIIGIDNDLALAPMIIKERENFHALETRNILFCIPYLMNQKIDQKLRDHILNLSPSQVLLTWLRALSLHNDQYEKLLKRKNPQPKTTKIPETTAAALETITTTGTAATDPASAQSDFSLLKLPLKLKAGTGLSLLKRMEKLHHCLSLKSATPTLGYLFEEMEPLAALYIQRVLKQKSSPLQAFNAIYNQVLSFEEVLDLEQRIPEHLTLGNALAKENHLKEAYKERFQSLDDIVTEVLKNTNFLNFSFQQQNTFLEEAALNFPQALKTALPHLSISPFDILKRNPTPRLLNILLDGSTPSLTSHQLFRLVRDILYSSLPEKTILLEKVLKSEGIEFGERDETGNTLLHLWAEKPDEPVPPFLIDQWKQKEGDFDTLNIKGESPLDRALSTFHVSFIEALLKKNVGSSYQEIHLENFYRSLKQKSHWKASSLRSLFQKRKEQDPHWKWTLQRTKIFLPPVTGQEIEILTYNGGNIKRETRTLSQEVETQLWDTKGFKATHTNGNRMVGRVILPSHSSEKKAIYFKRFPCFPGLSMAVSVLQEKLFRGGFLPLTFAKIKGEPFLISPGIGKIEKDEREEICETANLQHLLKIRSDRLNHLDEEALAQLIITAMLTNPEDGKPSNYAVDTIKSTGRSRIIGFDEEQAFVPAVSKAPETPLEKLTSVMVQMKSILFCLDAMGYDLPLGVKKTILAWDEFKLIKSWIQTLQILDQRMQALFEKKIEDLYKQKQSYIGIPFQKGEMTTLLNKLTSLKTYTETHPQARLWELFLHVEPFAALRYRPILNECKSLSILERFLRIDGAIYDQNKGIFEKSLSVMDHFPTSLKSAHLLNARHIPDFESRDDKLKKGLAKSSGGFDPVMALQELAHYETMMAKKTLQNFKPRSFEQGSTIDSLDRGEKPTSILLGNCHAISDPDEKSILTLLKGLRPRQLHLQFSTGLNQEWLKEIDLQGLTSLNLKGCGNINDDTLNLFNNLEHLNTLILSSIKGIKNFYFKEGIFKKERPLHFPVLEKLHLSKCENLESISCTAPKLKIIRASYSPRLTKIDLETPLLEFLDVKESNRLDLETLLTIARKIPTLKDVDIENCEKIPLKSIKMPFEERHMNFFEFMKETQGKSTDPNIQEQIGQMYAIGQVVKQDYGEAFRWYQKAAAQGNAEAYFSLGVMYGNGYGVKQDYVKALEYYHKAVGKGNILAMHNIATYYERGLGVPQDNTEAKKWFRRAAEQGLGSSQSALGIFCESGRGGEQDYTQALYWYEKAISTEKSEEDFLASDTNYRVARFYDRGLGISQDPPKAAKQYQKAYEIALKQAKEGNRAAYETLGTLYLRGKGVQKDEKAALEWFQKAAEDKEPEGQVWLGRLYKEGRGTSQNLHLAHLWIQKSAEQNWDSGLYNLALLYRDGEGVEQNDQKAIELLEKAAVYFDPDALYSLGWTYEQGRGVEKDLTKAQAYYEKGEQRHAEDALYSIGRMYELGLGGVSKDPQKAQEWYQKSADLGYELAHEKVKQKQDLLPPFKTTEETLKDKS